ncbi:MAG: germination protein YpeB [Bacillota bacterium]
MAIIFLAILSYWGYGQYQARKNLEIYLGNSYQRSFYEMVENIEQIQVNLAKAMVANSPAQNVLSLTKVWRSADLAQADLSQLPLSESTLYDTSKFLNQAGDYAHVLAQKNVKGELLNQKNREELQKLRKYSAQLSDALHQLEGKIFDDKINWSELVNRTADELGDSKNNFIAQNIDDAEEEMEKYPILIYDGPFSDHIKDMEPRAIEGKEVDRENVRKKAVDLLNIIGSKEVEIKDIREIKGKIVGYTVDLETIEGHIYNIDFSKKGGKIINIVSSRGSQEINFSQKNAIEKGKKFLESIGYKNMNSTFFEIKDNIAYISYAFEQEDVILYTDIIDLQVCLEDNRVMGMDALSYLVAHHDRNLEKVKISSNEAKKIASGKLNKVDSVQLALIPKSGLKEVLTYEVRGEVGNEVYLIYINALTGEEEQILQLISSSNGTFSI